MPCMRSLRGFRGRSVSSTTGLRPIVFSKSDGFSDLQVVLPCGQCRFCRLENSRQWAIRAVHEASMYKFNCFLTLTYSDKYLPKFGVLDYERPVKFMKDLRSRFGSGIRSFGCAEYGSKFSRPHFHICLFNFDFFDKKFFKKVGQHGEFDLSVSQDLQELWPEGFSTCGSLSFESAAYVARYVCKKVTGARAPLHYADLDDSTGEIFERPPERSICVSRSPGLGRPWYELFGEDAVRRGFVYIRGRKMRPPKYYEQIFAKDHPVEFAQIKEERSRVAKSLASELELESAWREVDGRRRMPRHRLSVMEDILETQSDLLKRGLENG